jgi:hypothetical protein
MFAGEAVKIEDSSVFSHPRDKAEQTSCLPAFLTEKI